MTSEQAFFKELNALVASEAKKYKLEELRATDWTLERMFKEHGLAKNPSRKVLDDLTGAGYFIKIRVANPNGGGFRIAYRPVEKK